MAGVLQEVKHPQLKGLLAKDVISFRTRYLAYERRIAELNSQRPVAQQIKPTELQHCIFPTTLKAFVTLEVFDDHTEEADGTPGSITSVDELNHDIVKAWMDDRATVEEVDTAARVSLALSEVKFEMDKTDPEGSVVTFFTDILVKLDEHGCSIVIDTAGKELCRKLLDMVQPKSVRDVLEAEWNFWPSQDKHDFHKFQKFVTNGVVEAAKWTSQKRSSEAVAQSESEPPAKKRRGKGKAGRNGGLGDSKKSSESGNGDDPKKSGIAEKWTKKCLNSDCSEHHPGTARTRVTNYVESFWTNSTTRKGRPRRRRPKA